MKTTIYRKAKNVVYSCRYHVVWCPKYRRKVLVDDVEARLETLVEEACNEYGIGIIEIKITPDRVYLLLEVDPQFGIHKAVKLLKSYTSKALRQEFPHLRTKMPTLWTNSYFVTTVGEASSEAIEQYVREQKTSQRQKDKLG